MPTLFLLTCSTGASFNRGKRNAMYGKKRQNTRRRYVLQRLYGISADIHVYLQLGLYLIRYIYLNQFNGRSFNQLAIYRFKWCHLCSFQLFLHNCNMFKHIPSSMFLCVFKLLQVCFFPYSTFISNN